LKKVWKIKMKRNINIALQNTIIPLAILSVGIIVATGCSGVAKTVTGEFTPPPGDRSTAPKNPDAIWPEGKGSNPYYSKVAVAPTTKSRQVVSFGGHYYQVVRYNVASNNYSSTRPNWLRCKDLASAMSYNGLQGHLVTITSQAEADFIKSAFGNNAIDKSDFVNRVNAGSGLVSPIRGLAIGGVLNPPNYVDVVWTGKGGVTEVGATPAPVPTPVAPATPAPAPTPVPGYANWAVQAGGKEPTQSSSEWALQINSIGGGAVVNSDGWNNYDGSDSRQTFGYIVEFE
jgi:hypothetical protein